MLLKNLESYDSRAVLALFEFKLSLLVAPWTFRSFMLLGTFTVYAFSTASTLSATLPQLRKGYQAASFYLDMCPRSLPEFNVRLTVGILTRRVSRKLLSRTSARFLVSKRRYSLARLRKANGQLANQGGMTKRGCLHGDDPDAFGIGGNRRPVWHLG